MRRIALVAWWLLVSCSGTSRAPDLTAGTVQFAPAAIAAGGVVTVNVPLHNLGDADAPAFNYEVWLGDPPSGAGAATGILLARRNLDGLARTSSNTQSFQVSIPAGTPVGLYAVTVIVDAGGQVPESNENNNRIPARNPLNVFAPGSDVNLVVGSVVPGSDELAAEDTLIVSFNVRNAGSDAVIVPTKTQFFLSSDDVLSAADRLIGEQVLAPLLPGESRDLVAQMTIPSDTEPANYRLLVAGDAEKIVAETNESDNVGSAPLKINGPTEIPGVDLILTALTVDPPAAPQGGAVTVRFTLKNRGSTDVIQSFINRIYLARSPTLNPTGDESIGTVNVSTIAAGESLDFEQVVDLPPGRAPGNYYIAVFADASEAVAESNEINNTRVDTGGLTIVAPAISDLVAEDVTLDGVSGGQVIAGAPLTVNFALGNNGPDASGSVTASILLSTRNDGIAAPGDRILGAASTANLVAGQTQTFSPVVTLPADLDNRHYYVGVLVDPDRRVHDPNRDNNLAFEVSGFTVLGGTGCTDDDFEPNDTRPNAVPLAPGSYEGLALCNGNEDWYTVDLAQGASLKVGIASPADPETIALDLELYAPGATVPTGSSLGVGNDERVIAPFVTVGGEYAIRVFGAGSGPYRLEIEVTPAGGEGIDLVPLEPSFTPAHADPGEQITVGFELRNVGSVDAPEVDYGIHLLPASAACSQEVSLGDFSTASLPAARGRILQQTVQIPPGTCHGDYFVSVIADPADLIAETFENNNAATGSEIFTVGGVNGCLDDELEPNDSLRSPRAIAPGTYGSLQVCPDDDDYYAVFLRDGESLDVLVEFTDQNGDLDLSLLAEDGTVLAESIGTGDSEHVHHVAGGDERVIVWVRGFAGSANAYTMTVTGGAGVDLRARDVLVAPAAVEVGGEIEVSFTIENLLPLSSPATIAEVRLVQGGAERTLHTVDVPALGPSAPDGAAKSFSEKLSLPQDVVPGVYDVHVVVDPAGAISEATTANNTAGVAGLRVAGACIPDDAEPNDSFAVALDVTPTPGTPTTLSGLNICLGDVDWFKVQIGPAETLTLQAQIQFLGSAGDLDLYLYDENGAPLMRSTGTTGLEVVSIAAPAAGTYYLKVIGFDSALNDYTLQVALQ